MGLWWRPAGRMARGTASASFTASSVVGGDLRDEVDESTDAAAWFAREEIATLPRTELVDIALQHLDAQ